MHDARIVAAMLSHRVTHLLTFNTADFKRYTEITTINPREV
jgi:predicted nucleic acid-binding protein